MEDKDKEIETETETEPIKTEESPLSGVITDREFDEIVTGLAGATANDMSNRLRVATGNRADSYIGMLLMTILVTQLSIKIALYEIMIAQGMLVREPTTPDSKGEKERSRIILGGN